MEQSRKGFYGAISDGNIGEFGPAGVYREFQAKMQFSAEEGDVYVHDDSETEHLLQSSPSPDGGSLERSRSAFCDNKVTTSKYTLVSFIPRSLLEQFRRVANLYFLIMSMLMLIGTYSSLYDSPITPWSTLATLFIVLSISMAKEALEDIKRHKADSVTNCMSTRRIGRRDSEDSARAVPVQWKDVQVGDILEVRNNEQIPADLIILASALPQNSAYIETANIDGESNLKLKIAAGVGGQSLAGASSGSDDYQRKAQLFKSVGSLTVQCEQPNSNIHHFHGLLFCNGREVRVDAASFLLRGSSLRNTGWILGVVVYTGRETKLVMNSRSAPSKLSNIEKTMNTLIYLIFLLQVLICIVSLVAFVLWKRTNYSELTYLCYNAQASSNALLSSACSAEAGDYSDYGYFFTFFILYNNFIPISLYVTVEVCNYCQAYFIDCDAEMYHEQSNMPAVARTSNMNSDLGMVECIFSDKTGTLTDNVMRFRRCCIAGQVYSDSDLPSASSSLEAVKRAMAGGDEPCNEFVQLLALCHTVEIAPDQAADSADGLAMQMQAESPDEEALVKAAAEFGWTFVGREQQDPPDGSSATTATNGAGTVVTLKRAHEGSDHALVFFDLLATIPFTSDRKRMSVIVRKRVVPSHSPAARAAGSRKRAGDGGEGGDGEILLYCKGADNILMDRCSAFADASAAELRPRPGPGPGEDFSSAAYLQAQKAEMMQQLNSFASDGLRTLVVARRSLSERELEQFRRSREAALSSMLDKDAMLAEAADAVERNLCIIGATAIEDKLQEGVPECVADLISAGIKLWVLTGDKVETAINIGYAARLLVPEMLLIKICSPSSGGGSNEVKAKLQALLLHFDKMQKGLHSAEVVWRHIQTSIVQVSTSLGLFNWPADGQSFFAASPYSQYISHSLLQAFSQPLAFLDVDRPLSSWGDRDRDQEAAEQQQQQQHEQSIESLLDPSSVANRAQFQLSSSRNVPRSSLQSIALGSVSSDHLALILDGESLLQIFGDEQAEDMLLALTGLCKCVLACRVSPEQKRLMVRLVKRGSTTKAAAATTAAAALAHRLSSYLDGSAADSSAAKPPAPAPAQSSWKRSGRAHVTTLSVGDGANDVAMIQEAQIGVGISGREGRQAVNASDFAIAQFRYLKRLLLIHGRYDYRRTSKVVLNSFYKNMVLTMVLFLFTFFSGYSGQSLFEDNIYMMYNIVLALPVVSLGVFDRDISEGALLSYPFFYVSGRMKLDLNIHTILFQTAQSIVDALVIFFVPYYVYAGTFDVWGNSSGSQGKSDGLWIFGTTVYTVLVVSMFIRCALLTYTWTWMSLVCFWLSFIFYFVFLLVYQFAYMISFNFYGVGNEMFNSPSFWWLLLLVPSFSGLLELTVQLVRSEFAPSVIDVGIELDRKMSRLPPAAAAPAVLLQPLSRPEEGAILLSDRPYSSTHTRHHNYHSDNTAAAALGAGAGAGAAGPEPGPEPDGLASLDWRSVQQLWAAMSPQEQESLGLHNASVSSPNSSTYNYDHVSSHYGPGAGQGDSRYLPGESRSASRKDNT